MCEHKLLRKIKEEYVCAWCRESFNVTIKQSGVPN
jgi:DNA-directed RNA polymerase subunit RPC12/RpoP